MGEQPIADNYVEHHKDLLRKQQNYLVQAQKVIVHNGRRYNVAVPLQLLVDAAGHLLIVREV